MSYSNDTKSEMMKQTASGKCCRLSLAAGLLFDAEVDGDRLLASYPTREVANFARRAVNGAFGRDSASTNSGAQGRGFDLAMLSPQAAELLSGIDEKGCEGIFGEKCELCRGQLLRGAFIASGSVTDPHRQYHLEFLFENAHRAKRFYEFLVGTVGTPSIINRKSGVGLVIKNSSQIEDVLSTTGAVQAYFSLLNDKIERDIRNHANRATNCETRNISAAVEAASKHLEAIRTLHKNGRFFSLPKELRETAELREQYPALPLSELARMHTPPISKSGLSHRLAKILDFLKN